LIHFISADAVVSAESEACAAPSTTKDEPGSAWNVAATDVFAALNPSLQRAYDEAVRPWAKALPIPDAAFAVTLQPSGPP
jgi:hypothetical protein